MNHDFRKQPAGADADRFLAWLERETVDTLKRSRGDVQQTKAAIFLYANRAYEAHLPEAQIGALFGKCFAGAGLPAEDEETAFDHLEFVAQLAERTHKDA